jgi:predicted short-subunit dehydrogenase-like oxidoreductase (DUF2520 family)
MKAKICFRDGGFYLTEIDERHTPETLAQRMTGGGFVVCEDNRWGKHRVIVVNLTDVKCIVLEDTPVPA